MSEIERAARDVIRAWEKDGSGRDFSVHQIQQWLIDDMGPAMVKLRKAMGLTVPANLPEEE